MKPRPWLVLAALVCSCAPRGAGAPTMTDISQVTYTSESGAILPEWQWYEEVVITRGQVRLTRRGKATDTKANVGTWTWAMDEVAVAALFERLEAIDPAKIREVAPDDPTDGGGTETYQIVYAGDKSLFLSYGQGTTYSGGELIVEPVNAFVARLSLPAGAEQRYHLAPDRP